MSATTKVICDFNLHFVKEHEAARKLGGQWKQLMDKAKLIAPEMTDVLWREYEPSHRGVLLALMCRYRLAVQIGQVRVPPVMNATTCSS